MKWFNKHFIILFLIYNFINAQWIQNKGPLGGSAEFLFRANNDDLVAANSWGGIFKSTDNGNTWVASIKGLITSDKTFTKVVSLTKSITGKFFLHASYINEDRVFVSTDNGNSWTKLPDQIWGGGKTIETPNGTLFQVPNREIMKSIDGGLTWITMVTNGLPAEQIINIIAINNDEIFVVLREDKGIYKSTDGGNNWKKLNSLSLSAVTGVNIFYLNNALYCLTGMTIQKSTDKGETWTYIYNPPVFGVNPTSIIVAENGNLFFTGGASAYKSTDNGTTWNEFSIGYDIASPYTSLVATKNSEIIINRGAHGFFKSQLSSPNFKLSNEGFIASNVVYLHETKSGKLYCATDWAVFQSSDFGITWSRLLQYFDDITSVIEKDQYVFISRYYKGVMRSSNGGATWMYVNGGNTLNLGVKELVLTDNGTILARTHYGLFRSTNNGDTWTKITSLGSNVIASIIKKLNNELFVSTGNKFYRSNDDGLTWNQVSLGKLVSPETNLDGSINVLNHISDSKNNLYLNFGGNFYLKSKDNGSNWEKISIPTKGITSIKSIIIGNNDSIFVTTNYGVLLSTDYGISHKEISDGLISRTINSMFKLNNGQLLLLTYGSGIYRKGNVSTYIKEDLKNLPLEFSLSQNYPNPFNPATTIKYSIPNVRVNPSDHDNFVTLKVYDVLGKEVSTLVNEYQPAGNYEVKFDASKLSGGVYFYKLQVRNFVQTKKMILIK